MKRITNQVDSIDDGILESHDPNRFEDEQNSPQKKLKLTYLLADACVCHLHQERLRDFVINIMFELFFSQKRKNNLKMTLVRGWESRVMNRIQIRCLFDFFTPHSPVKFFKRETFFRLFARTRRTRETTNSRRPILAFEKQYSLVDINSGTICCQI